MENNKHILACKTLSMLAAEYGTSSRTFKKMLLKVPGLQVENRDTREYTPKEVELIYKHLGLAGSVFEDD